MNRVRQLVQEIHRRSLWQVLGIFMAASWAVLQVVEVLTQTAGLPDWTPTMALVLLLIGLPICLATAFVQEGMPGAEAPSTEPGAEQGTSTTASPNLAAGTGSLDLASTRPSSTKRLLTWKNAVVGGVGGFALLGLSLVAYFVMWSTGIGPVGNLVAQGVIDARDPVILAEFENRTSDDILGVIVTDALRVDLLESRIVTLVDDRSLAGALQRMGLDRGTRVDATVAREIAVREGIKATIEGNVSSVGGGYLLAVEIISPSDGATLAAFRETAESDSELLAAIDRLSQRLREKAGESLRDLRAEEPLAAVTTNSLEALRLFSQAGEAEDSGDVVRAIALLEDAVRLDSTFAMAWRKLAVQHSNRGNDVNAQIEAATAAYRHRERLTERERYLAEAYYQSSVALDSEAEAAAYRRVLEIQPDDPVALNNLGLYYSGRSRWERSVDLYLRAIDGPGRSSSAFNNLAIAQFSLGDPDAALATVDEWERSYPPDLGSANIRLRIHWGTGQHERASEIARETLAALPDDPFAQLGLRRVLAAIERARGRIDASRELVLEMRAIAGSASNAVGVFQAELDIASLELLSGADTVATVRRIERLFEESLADVPEINRPYGDVAQLWGTARNAEQAEFWGRRALDNFPEVARSSGIYQEIELLIEAMVAQLTDDSDTALENIIEVRRRQECADCFLDVLADIYAEQGQSDLAIAELEHFLSSKSFSGIAEREIAAANRLPQLARLYEEVGRDAEAAETWTRFADRWADADAVLQARVRAARGDAERLARGGR